MDNRKKIIIKIEDYEYEMETALLGGIKSGDPQHPMGIYAGTLAIEDIGMALLHALRATLKISLDVHKMDIETAESFILFTVHEAVKRERARMEKVDFDHEDIIMRMSKKL